MLQLINELFCPCAALVAGTLTYRSMDRFFRLLYAQLTTWLLFYAVGYVVTLYQNAHGRPSDNQFVMNIHLLFETGLLTLAARFSLRGFFLKTTAFAAYMAFLVVFALQGYYNGFGVYLNFADVTACIALTVLYLLLLYDLSQRELRTPWYAPKKLVCFGLLFYFAGSVVYVAIMPWLQKTDPGQNKLVYYTINDVLAIARYLALAVAFWLLRRNPLTFKQHP